MQDTAIPSKIPVVWASSPDAGTFRVVPTAPPTQNGAASLQKGFPAATIVPIAAGGSWPFAQDFNGILNLITAWQQWGQAGGPIYYDATFSTAIGGYPKGAELTSSATSGLVWISTADNNTTNPDSGGANWVPAQQWTAGLVSSVTGATIQDGVLVIPAAVSQEWTAGSVSSVSGGTVSGNVLTIPAQEWTAGAVSSLSGATISGGRMTINFPSAPAQEWNAGTVNSVSGGTVSGGVLTIPAQVSQVGRLLNVRYFTASTTYTPTAGTNSVIVEVQAGGGAGGGGEATGTGQQSAGAGGGAGGYARKRILSGFSGVALTVGTGGAPVLGGGGGSGGASSFGALVSATAGGGGSVGLPDSVSNGFPLGTGTAGTGVNGDINSAGGAGFYAFYDATDVTSGYGGASHFGAGGTFVTGTSFGNGSPSLGAGGGGGAQAAASGAAVQGGVGGAGIVIVWEFA